MPDDPLIKEWATKVKTTYENSEAVDHLTNMSKPQIQKETNKMEGVEKESKVEKAHDIDIRKRRQEEELMGLEEEPSLLKNAEQVKDINTSAKSKEKKSDETRIKEKKAKKNQKIPLENILQDSKKAYEEEVQKEIHKLKVEEDASLTALENQIIATSVPLEDSLWAPENRECNRKNSFKANVPAYNVPGENSKDRVNYLRWVLRGNKHIKAIREEFKRGNNWVIIDFDCEHNRCAAIEKVKKKEEWLIIIPEEEESVAKENFEQNNKYKKEANYNHCNDISEEDLSEKEKDDDKKASRLLTIWDLPPDINEKEIRYMCRSFKKLHIIRIKRSQYKALAVIEVGFIEKENIPWSLPLGN
ncbi:11342_t:CDS:1, partial [Paraglomus occultum]